MTPFIKKGYEEGSFDHTISISLADAVECTAELAGRGFFVGHQTGGVYHAALSAVRDYGITGDVVMISGDSGWKNMEKLLQT